MIKEFIANNQDAILKDLGTLVAHNSVYSEDEAPFGAANRAVLNDALAIFSRLGLKTKDLDGYCGYGEIGEGDKVIGILAHLDIVPAGDGWDSDPFKLTRRGDVVYGRGVSDDKGAVIASLYAIKYLMDSGYKFNSRVRLIVGCNEETGSRCIAHYVEKEGAIDMGFTPDANFPGIFAEKGILGGKIIAKSSAIEDIKGGTASNVVCKEVKARIKKVFAIDELMAYFDRYDLEYTIDYNDDTYDITLVGLAAHASTPDLGVNAINHLFNGLYESGLDDELVKYMHEKIGLDNHGSLIGCDVLKDEYSDLTMNLGVIGKVDDHIEISVDIRFPVTRSTDEVAKIVKNGLEDKDIHFLEGSRAKPLFFDLDDPMIKALKKAYVTVTGDDKSEMQAIGGGTYAKAMPNCIAFGCEFEGENNHIHDANESLSLTSLSGQIEIFAQAIKNLDEVVNG